MPAWFKGELLGTFLLVFFGCGAVATAVALEVPVGIFQVAVVWGLGLVVAIYLTAGLSGAHLNPAVTLAFALARSFPRARIPGYFLAQFLGAFLAAACVFALFAGGIRAREQALDLERGRPGSEATAMIFGEYFPNPGGQPLTGESRATVSHGMAFLAEFMGTALLALAVLGFTASGNPSGPGAMIPLAIGLTLTALICIFGPLTMACFNPARDLAPRLFSSLTGWGGLVFQVNGMGWLTVYILAPCLGGLTGGWLARQLYPEKAHVEAVTPLSE